MESEDRKTIVYKLVMLIDDNEIDNFVNKSIIEKNNFAENVISFTKAGDALEYLSDIDDKSENPREIPSLIFLDLNMPLINGFQFLEIFDKLSAFIKSNCKIVILSSSGSMNDIVKSGTDKNVLTFLQKPLLKNSIDELNMLIEKESKIVLK